MKGRFARIAALACVFLGGLGQGVVAPRFKELIGESDQLALDSGVAASLMYLGMFASAGFWGKLADRSKSHWALSPGLFLYAGCLAALGKFHTPWAIFFFRALEGVALAALFVSADFVIGRCTEAVQRASWFAYYGIALSAGLIMGPLASLGIRGSSSDLLYTLALICTLVGLSILPVRVGAGERETKRDSILSQGALATGVAYGFLEAGLVSVFPVIAPDSGSIRPEHVLILVVVSGGLGALSWGAAADRFGAAIVAVKLFTGLVIATWLSVMGTILVPSENWLYVYGLVFGFFGGGMSPVGFAWLLASAGQDQFGRASSSYLRWYGLGSLVGPLATGAGFEYGRAVGMLVVLGGMVFGCLCYLRKREDELHAL